jgi:hypothetical protein
VRAECSIVEMGAAAHPVRRARCLLTVCLVTDAEIVDSLNRAGLTAYAPRLGSGGYSTMEG